MDAVVQPVTACLCSDDLLVHTYLSDHEHEAQRLNNHQHEAQWLQTRWLPLSCSWESIPLPLNIGCPATMHRLQPQPQSCARYSVSHANVPLFRCRHASFTDHWRQGWPLEMGQLQMLTGSEDQPSEQLPPGSHHHPPHWPHLSQQRHPAGTHAMPHTS